MAQWCSTVFTLCCWRRLSGNCCCWWRHGLRVFALHRTSVKSPFLWTWDLAKSCGESLRIWGNNLLPKCALGSLFHLFQGVKDHTLHRVYDKCLSTRETISEAYSTTRCPLETVGTTTSHLLLSRPAPATVELAGVALRGLLSSSTCGFSTMVSF